MDSPEDNVSLNAVDDAAESGVTIKLIGVGGAGMNAVDRLKMESPRDVHLAVINTDAQALASSVVEQKCLIGKEVTRGLGTGGDPELGRTAAEADIETIKRLVQGVDLVFLLAGMGGGTGSGAAPVVAKTAEKAGAVVIAFTPLPFHFEGVRRQKQADEGLRLLRQCCSAVIPLPNDLVFQQMGDSASVLDAFARADEWIARAVRSIWCILFKTGLINLDFAGLRQVFRYKGGKTLFGLGRGSGTEAVHTTIEELHLCPLLHTPEFSRHADRLLVNIIGGAGLSLSAVERIMDSVKDSFGREAHIVMGAVIDEGLGEAIEVCVIGTTDIGNRLPAKSDRQQAVPPIQSKQKSDESTVTATPGHRWPAPVHDGDGVLTPSTRAKQEEFEFSESGRRGFFDNTDEVTFEGEDLDRPTFLRKGIKIHL